MLLCLGPCLLLPSCLGPSTCKKQYSTKAGSWRRQARRKDPLTREHVADAHDKLNLSVQLLPFTVPAAFSGLLSRFHKLCCWLMCKYCSGTGDSLAPCLNDATTPPNSGDSLNCQACLCRPTPADVHFVSLHIYATVATGLGPTRWAMLGALAAAGLDRMPSGRSIAATLSSSVWRCTARSTVSAAWEHGRQRGERGGVWVPGGLTRATKQIRCRAMPSDAWWQWPAVDWLPLASMQGCRGMQGLPCRTHHHPCRQAWQRYAPPPA